MLLLIDVNLDIFRVTVTIPSNVSQCLKSHNTSVSWIDVGICR
jgi:hypothetical protein